MRYNIPIMKKAIFITSFFILIAGFAMFSAPKAEASFWDHFSIGIGFGSSYASYGGYDSYYGYDDYGYDDYGYGGGYDYYPTSGYYGNPIPYGNDALYAPYSYGGYNNGYGNSYYPSYPSYPSYQSYPTYNYPTYQSSYGNYSPTSYSTPIAPTYGYYSGGCNNNYGCNTYQNSLSWTH